ncbi:alpha/beta fold hydrolase [Streptomyces sp. NPDC003077]|uniref:alpha/beta fold hydrolase n=1 Tax=Streptomyces sp. NPDC003077 TaxID=3154443 RepID=UPI0033B521D7
MSRIRWVAVGSAPALVAAALVWAVAPDGPDPVHREDHLLTGADGVRLDASYFTSPGKSRRPAVLLSHGFGGTKDGERDRAERLARAGYAVLTYSARGFGASGGRIGLNAADGEVADVGRLLDWLAGRPEVRLDGTGDPVVGVAGNSYGGALSLLAAGQDPRIDAAVPSNTYWDLREALFPGGVFKKMWAGILFGQGLTDPRDPQCGRFTAAVCSAFQRSAVLGRADARTGALLRGLSPAAHARRIAVPTLVVQGQTDSLFPLGQGDAIARAVARNGAPVAVDWIDGGHDGGDGESTRIADRTVAWFDAHLKKDTEAAGTGPAFRISRNSGKNAEDGTPVLQEITAGRYPGLDGTEQRTVPLDGEEKTLANPAGGSPPTITAVPGLGALTRLTAALGSGPQAGPALVPPAQSAVFTGPPLDDALQVTGAPTVDLTVRSKRTAVLFAKLYDVAPDGRQTQPRQSAAPVTLADGRTARVSLPALDHRFAPGHRLRIVVSTTDLGFASPIEPATYRLRAGALTVPVVPALKATVTSTLPGWIWPLPAAALAVAAALALNTRHPARTTAPDPALTDVPLQVSGLTKKYTHDSDRYAVRHLTFTVERGQVLGLLGPNGAGKTTTLRMLMGLIRPDAGELRIYGHPVHPGSPVLSRLGSFVEGAGFLPHLTGRQNLDLYWRATGRPVEDAHAEQALSLAGLGDALDRAVRTYSQGMRQRLAIAQAMLGLPDLLVLDEPTNGLDPGQIREMRDVLIRYAAEGRTVIVSSHLLAEVEQCCTHLVVMDRGELITAGPIGEIAGDGDELLIGTPEPPDGTLTGKVAALPGVGAVTAAGNGLLVRLQGMTTPELLAELVGMGVAVESVGPHRRLEDTFLTLTGEDR